MIVAVAGWSLGGRRWWLMVVMVVVVGVAQVAVASISERVGTFEI